MVRDTRRATRHLQLSYITDPTTGKRYPIPAGGDPSGDPPPDDPPPNPGSGSGDPGDPPPDDPPLGPEGEKALDAWKTRAKAAEKEKKDLEERLSKLEDDKKTDHERAVEAARKEAAEAVRGEVGPQLQQAVKENAILRRANGKVVDLDVAVALLKDKPNLLDENGQVDVKALDSEITKLLEDKPHLAAAEPGKQPPPRPHQGGGKAPSGSSDVDAAYEAAAKRAGLRPAPSNA